MKRRHKNPEYSGAYPPIWLFLVFGGYAPLESGAQLAKLGWAHTLQSDFSLLLVGMRPVQKADFSYFLAIKGRFQLFPCHKGQISAVTIQK